MPDNLVGRIEALFTLGTFVLEFVSTELLLNARVLAKLGSARSSKLLSMFSMVLWRACFSVLSEWVSGKDNTKSIQHLTGISNFV